MRVRVYSPGFTDLSILDEGGFADLPDGATLGDLLKKLKAPFRPGLVLFYRVNYEKASLSRVLSDGDTISFFAPLSGG